MSSLFNIWYFVAGFGSLYGLCCGYPFAVVDSLKKQATDIKWLYRLCGNSNIPFHLLFIFVINKWCWSFLSPVFVSANKLKVKNLLKCVFSWNKRHQRACPSFSWAISLIMSVCVILFISSWYTEMNLCSFQSESDRR